MEFRYLGLESWANRLRPGGTIGFKETSPGTVWIDRWMIRMTGAPIDRGGPRRGIGPQVVEGGAELASARWPDGGEWHGTFAAAALNLVNRDGSPLRGARVQLDSTDYRGVTDSTGRVLIDELLPGPYRVSVFDSVLAVVDTALPGATGFTALRGNMVDLLVPAPTLREFMAERCRAEDAFNEGSRMLVARIVRSDSVTPVRARWRLEVPAGEADPIAPGGVYAHGVTTADGRLYVCAKLNPGRRVVLRAWGRNELERESDAGTAVAVILSQPVSAVKLAVPR